MDISSPRIVIAVSKTKIVIILLAGLVLVAVGVALIYQDSDPIAKTIGWASVIFFGACLIMGLIKLFDSKPGLIIDETGISDNSLSIKTGAIRWEDILEIDEINIHNQSFIRIYLKEPERHIEKLSGPSKKMAQLNHKLYGSPYSISASTLKCEHQDLLMLLRERLSRTRN